MSPAAGRRVIALLGLSDAQVQEDECMHRPCSSLKAPCCGWALHTLQPRWLGWSCQPAGTCATSRRSPGRQAPRTGIGVCDMPAQQLVGLMITGMLAGVQEALDAADGSAVPALCIGPGWHAAGEQHSPSVPLDSAVRQCILVAAMIVIRLCTAGFAALQAGKNIVTPIQSICRPLASMESN